MSARGDVTALKKLSEGLDFDKATARGILNLAAALTDKAEYPRALELLQALQRRHPDDYWVNFDLALALVNRPNINRYAEASRYAAVAVALRPDAASGHCLLGNLSRREDAVHELREAMRINPRFHIAQLVLGKHLLEMGRLDEAVAARAHVRRGRARLATGSRAPRDWPAVAGPVRRGQGRVREGRRPAPRPGLQLALPPGPALGRVRSHEGPRATL